MRRAIGYQHRKQVRSKIAIIGAGPAGLSCALWLSNMGCRPILLERAPHAGGMLRFNHHSNDWLLGFPDTTGHAIKDRFLSHLQHRNISIMTSVLPTSIVREEGGFVISFPDPARKIYGDFLVIASGTRPRAPMELVGLATRFPDKFLIGAGGLRIDTCSSGTRMTILGGGDNAFENAWQLASRGVNVDVYYRAEARAHREWLERCATMPNIICHSHTSTGNYALIGDKVTFTANGEPRQADALAVMYGYEPNTETLREIASWLTPAIDKEGFIKVNDYQQTRIPHVYAIGDVTDRPLPCLPSAIGQGSIAAKAIMLDAEGMLP